MERSDLPADLVPLLRTKYPRISTSKNAEVSMLQLLFSWGGGGGGGGGRLIRLLNHILVT